MREREAAGTLDLECIISLLLKSKNPNCGTNQHGLASSVCCESKERRWFQMFPSVKASAARK